MNNEKYKNTKETTVLLRLQVGQFCEFLPTSWELLHVSLDTPGTGYCNHQQL